MVGLCEVVGRSVGRPVDLQSQSVIRIRNGVYVCVCVGGGNGPVGRRVGLNVGDLVGNAVTGELEGFLEGDIVGNEVKGADDGDPVGNDGLLDGFIEGGIVEGRTRKSQVKIMHTNHAYKSKTTNKLTGWATGR